MFFKQNEYTKALSDYVALGFEEEITEENFVIPTEADYVDFGEETEDWDICLLYTSPSPRDATLPRMPSSA